VEVLILKLSLKSPIGSVGRFTQGRKIRPHFDASVTQRGAPILDKSRGPRRVGTEAWRELAHPDAPPLPWLSDNGTEICSFSILSAPGSGRCKATLYDAYGREVSVIASRAAIEATVLALGRRRDELTFLPAP